MFLDSEILMSSFTSEYSLCSGHHVAMVLVVILDESVVYSRMVLHNIKIHYPSKNIIEYNFMLEFLFSDHNYIIGFRAHLAFSL